MGELFAQLGIDWRLLLAQAVNFLLVLWILKRFVFQKLIRFMEDRQRRIQEGLEMREQAQQELQRSQEMRATEIARARKDTEEILAQAKETAGERERELIARAKQEAEKLLLRAKDDIQRESEAAKKEVREDIVSVTMLAAEKILERAITEKDRERMMKEVMETIDAK